MSLREALRGAGDERRALGRGSGRAMCGESSQTRATCSLLLKVTVTTNTKPLNPPSGATEGGQAHRRGAGSGQPPGSDEQEWVQLFSNLAYGFSSLNKPGSKRGVVTHARSRRLAGRQTCGDHGRSGQVPQGQSTGDAETERTFSESNDFKRNILREFTKFPACVPGHGVTQETQQNQTPSFKRPHKC